MSVSFAAVIVVIVGGATKPIAGGDEDIETVGTPWWAWFVLFLNPFLKAFGTISLR